MRPATACHACRVSKRKCRPCTQGGPTACARCYHQRITCSFASRPSSFHLISGTFCPLDARQSGSEDKEFNSRAASASGTEAVWQSPCDDVALREELANYYFNVVHDTHHSLFHRPSFEVDWKEGRVADVIMYSILSLGSRFLTTSSPCYSDSKRLCSVFAEKAHRSLEIRDVSITTVQGCILLGTLCYADGDGAAEAVYYATAARLAIIMDLPRRRCISELERQLNLRVWWTLYMIDIWSSAGLQLSRQLSYREEADLPMEEVGFLELTPDTLHDGQQSRVVGIWGEMARLAYLWSLIQDLNKRSVEENLAPATQTTAIKTLACQLSEWKDALPSFLQETPENLKSMASSGLGTAFAALHLGFHYYHEVLFYQFMAESHQSPSTLADQFADECSRHALDFCDLLYLCEGLEGCKCLYAMVGHMLVVTSTVYVHMLLFTAPTTSTENDKASGMDKLRCRLERNFEILTSLQKYWTTLDVSLERLKVFHNACLRSIEHSFRMDRWMLRFILEHGSSMPEKFDGTSGNLMGKRTTVQEDPTLTDLYKKAPN